MLPGIGFIPTALLLIISAGVFHQTLKKGARKGTVSPSDFYFTAAGFLFLRYYFGDGINAGLLPVILLSCGAPLAALMRRYRGSQAGDSDGLRFLASYGVFFLFGFIIFYIFISKGLLGPETNSNLLSAGTNISNAALAAGCSLVITAGFYAMPGRTENLTMILITGLLSALILKLNTPGSINALLTGIAAASAISIFSVLTKMLTPDGAAAQLVIGAFIFGLGGWKWTVPILTFFLLSSILSKIRKRKNPEAENFFEKSGVRDKWQVLANGGTAAVLMIVYKFLGPELLYTVYVSSIAAVCADTWGTEIGTLRKNKTYSILKMKEVEPGSQGGISAAGSAGTLLGAFIIALSSLHWIDAEKLIIIIIITAAGLAGSIADSLLGESVQAQFICGVCGKITERKNHCGDKTLLSGGVKWISNDTVNFITGITGALAFLLLTAII